uniref:Uncharacterized protein n=1 Tax=Opuntia streptacantha TaxID=393608 RepID=A0A7C9AEC1_OPUST
MSQPLKLVNPASCLDIRVISGSNSPHTGGFVPSIRLRTILKIRIRPTRTVDTDIPSCSNVRAPVRLRHDSNDGNPRSCSNRLGSELGKQGGPIGFRDGGDHFHQLGRSREAVLPASGGLQGVEVDSVPHP